MPATLRSLVADRTLGLIPLCPAEQLDVPISWVHISELPDPAAYLDGGELLLTTGLGIDDDTDLDAFVATLVARRLAGLGFGTGLSHAAVPPGLVLATRRHGLPLIEIPERTPFIAVTKAASAALAADAYAQVVRTDEAQRALTAAAVGPQGTARVLRRLAQRLDAWVLLLDAAGEVEVAVPGDAVGHLAELADAVTRVRNQHGPSSAAVPCGRGQAVLQTLRLRGRGILAVGRDAGFGAAERQIVGSAVSILTLLHTSTAAVDRARRDLRAALLSMAVGGAPVTAKRIATDLWGPQPEEPLSVVAFHGRPRALAELTEALEADGPEHGPVFAAPAEHGVVAFAESGSSAQEWLLGLAATRPAVYAGVAGPVGEDGIGDAERRARQAAELAERTGAPVVRFAEIARSPLLDLLPKEDARAFADSVLAPLLQHDEDRAGDLVASLREWLGQHGQWEPAAARLGVHRHTLRNRIRRVEQLLERSLDSPALRADLWLALEAHDRS